MSATIEQKSFEFNEDGTEKIVDRVIKTDKSGNNDVKKTTTVMKDNKIVEKKTVHED